jgi:DNA polymerase I-like protein with 3'-5' exonuclease and polymerase domains/uracil-DNA glycosylase
MTSGKQLPIYLGTPVEDASRDPCEDCNLKMYGSQCKHQPLVIYNQDGQPVFDSASDRLELLVVADTPSFKDNKAKKFWADESGQSLLRRVKKLGVKNFGVIPAVRCYTGGDIDHNVLTKKYKNSPKFERETPLLRAQKAVQHCKEYTRTAVRELNPKMVLAMGPLATAALDMPGTVPVLRSTPVHPKAGLRAATPDEGVIVTFDRFESSFNDWAFRDTLRDLAKVKVVREHGYASQRGRDDTAVIHTLDTVEKVKKFVNWALTEKFEPHEIMCLDFETENMDVSVETNKLLNVGFTRTCDENVSYVVPLSHPETPFTPEDLAIVFKLLKKLFYSKGASFYAWCGHNTQYEVTMIKLFFDVWLGEGGGIKTLDTMVMLYALDEDRTAKGINKPYALETTAKEFIDFRWYAKSAMKSKRDRLSSESIAAVNEYVGMDSIVTARVVNELLERMQEEGSDADLLRLSTRLYGPGIHYTVDLKLTGQYIDIELLRMLRAENSAIVSRLREIEATFASAPEVAQALQALNQATYGGTGMKPLFKGKANATFSLTSQEHRKALFWDVLELEGANESVDKKFQEKHKGHPLVKLFAEYQSLSKLDSSYLKPLAEWLQSPNSVFDGRVRPNFNLVNTRTGRLSASSPNCYDKDTEILTKRGWVLFPELRDDDEVAQWWPDGHIDFTVPHNVVRQKYEGSMVKLKNQHIDLLVTPNHRCPLRVRRTEKLKVFTADKYPEDHKQHHAGVYSGGNVSVSPEMMTLICAAQADGSWRSDVAQGAMELTFTKSRKIDRLKAALDALGSAVSYTLKPKGEGWRFYISKSPALEHVLDVLTRDKVFTPQWLLSLDRYSLDLFVNEVNHWDGCFTRDNQYTSTVKQNVDIVQIAHTLSDIRSTVNRHSSPQTPAWAIYQTARNYSMTTNIERHFVSYDDMIYCVAVPSSFVVVRRNGVTAVSGNTQQLPRGDSDAKKQIKALFKATKGNVLVQLDFSQAEVRWLGILSGDEALAAKYKKADEIAEKLLLDPTNQELILAKDIDGDLHMSTAIQMYKLDIEWVKANLKLAKKTKRQAAKAVCFGLIYGKSAKSLAADLGISVEEAEEAVELWLSQFPKAAAWLKSQEDFAVEHGYVKSAFGRWRRLPEVQCTNQSVVNRAKRQSRNTPIQSAASDCCIYAACKLRDALRFSEDPKLRQVKLINTVHDSLVAECPADPDVIRAYCKLAKSIFTDRHLLMADFGVDLTVPLAVDFDIGLNWGSMQDYDFTEKALARALHDAEVLRTQPPGTLFDHLKGKGLLFDEQEKRSAA